MSEDVIENLATFIHVYPYHRGLLDQAITEIKQLRAANEFNKISASAAVDRMITAERERDAALALLRECRTVIANAFERELSVGWTPDSAERILLARLDALGRVS